MKPVAGKRERGLESREWGCGGDQGGDWDGSGNRDRSGSESGSGSGGRSS